MSRSGAIQMLPAHSSQAPMVRAAQPDAHIIFWLLVVFITLRAALPPGQLDVFYHYDTVGGGIIEKIHPGAYGIIGLMLLVLLTQDSHAPRSDQLIRNASQFFFFAAVFVLTLGAVTGNTAGLGYLIDSLLMGPILAVIFIRLNDESRARLFVWLIYLVIVNDVIAFGEYATNRRLLAYPNEWDLDTVYFRPGALFGHPLTVGQISAVSIPMLWLMPWTIIQRLLVGLFFMATAFICGARVSSIFCVLELLVGGWIHIRSLLKRNEIDEGTAIVTAVIAIAGIGTVLVVVVATGMAARFQQLGMFTDESSEYRFRIYSLFDFLSTNQFLFGVSPKLAIFIEKNMLHLIRSESPFVDMIVQFGFVGTCILIPALLYFLWSLSAKSNVYILVAAIAFILITSTNNDFTTKGPSMAFFSALALSGRSLARITRTGRMEPRRVQLGTRGL